MSTTAKVYIEQTSTIIFKTQEAAQSFLDRMIEQGAAGGHITPERKVVTYHLHALTVEQFRELQKKGRLPMLFDHQQFVIFA